jgi:hypothetical protein
MFSPLFFVFKVKDLKQTKKCCKNFKFFTCFFSEKSVKNNGHFSPIFPLKNPKHASYWIGGYTTLRFLGPNRLKNTKNFSLAITLCVIYYHLLGFLCALSPKGGKRAKK